jgi:ABC-type antimicrobial peptide transport system permease subunit
MTQLAWANIKHRKLRSALASLAVAIGVAMLITMLALSHGTLEEVAQRVKGIDADLILLPSQSSLIFTEGAPLSDKYVEKIQAVSVQGKRVVKNVIPVYLSIMPKMAGQQQRVFCVEPDNFPFFTVGTPLIKGKIFDADHQFKNYLAQLRKNKGNDFHPDQVEEKQLDQACELVIDSRLARAGRYKVGDTVSFLGKNFTITGIVEAGAAGRVFAPIDVIRQIELGGIQRSSLFFIKLDSALVNTNGQDESKIPVSECASAITQATRQKVASLSDYDKMLFDSFRSIYLYINIASTIVLVVSFLFIMVTIYTMVLERRREIGILRSMGARGGYILWQTILEALIISVVGTIAGVLLSLVAKTAIEYFCPLLTVSMQIHWIGLAFLVGIVGGLFSALYPGYYAIRQDPVTSLGYE